MVCSLDASGSFWLSALHVSEQQYKEPTVCSFWAYFSLDLIDCSINFWCHGRERQRRALFGSSCGLRGFGSSLVVCFSLSERLQGIVEPDPTVALFTIFFVGLWKDREGAEDQSRTGLGLCGNLWGSANQCPLCLLHVDKLVK